MPTTNLDKRGDGKGRDKEEALAMGYFIDASKSEVVVVVVTESAPARFRCAVAVRLWGREFEGGGAPRLFPFVTRSSSRGVWRVIFWSIFLVKNRIREKIHFFCNILDF